MTRKHPVVVAAFVVLLLVGAAAPYAVAPAQAQDDSDSDDGDSGFFDSLVGADNDDSGDGFVASVLRSVGIPNPMASARNWMYRNNPFHDAKRTPTECTDDIMSEVNNNAASYTEYVNERSTAQTAYDTLEIRCELTQGGETTSSTIYVTADVNGTNYENVSVSESPPENRSVDERLVLTGIAAEELPDDLVEFRKEYVEEDETPTRGYVISKGAKYKGYVWGSPSFLPAYDSETATGEE